MTEFHFAEMVQGAVSNSMTSLTIWLTIVSGYLFVAYSVGKELNKVQIVIINALFLASSAIFVGATYTFLSRAVNSMKVKSEVFPSGVLPVPNVPIAEIVAMSLAVLMCLGVLASLYFMINVRNRND